MNTYHTSVKYEYEGARQRIVPLTIKQLAQVLSTLAAAKDMGRAFTRFDIRTLFDAIVAAALDGTSLIWAKEHIPHALREWKRKVTA